MSLTAETLGALLRALVISSVALALAAPLARHFAAIRGRARLVLWALLLLPFLTPTLLTGYAWSQAALWLVVHPRWRDLLYAALLTVKLVPMAVLIRLFAPSPLSRAAAHCHVLLTGSKWARLRFAWQAGGRSPLAAFSLVALLAVSEFELAAMWSVPTWTVTIFDAQIGGLPLAGSLRLMLGPLLAQMLMLIPLVLTLRSFRARARGELLLPTGGQVAFIWSYLAGSAALVSLLPLGLVLTQAAAGFRAVVSSLALSREIAGSVVFAAASSAAAFLLARSLRARPRILAMLSLPGLLGALVLSLALLAAFQVRALRSLYDSPLPLLLALTLLLLPLAAILRLVLELTRRGEALHLARLLGQRQLLWQLETRRTFLTVLLLFAWAYFDFTAGSLLAPLELTPAFVRLHNLSHYGQTAVLSAMLCASLAAPVLVLLFTLFGVRLHARAR